jgi:hypothetical protein
MELGKDLENRFKDAHSSLSITLARFDENLPVIDLDNQVVQELQDHLHSLKPNSWDESWSFRGQMDRRDELSEFLRGLKAPRRRTF